MRFLFAFSLLFSLTEFSLRKQSHEKEFLTRIPLAWPKLLKSRVDWDYETTFVFLLLFHPIPCKTDCADALNALTDLRSTQMIVSCLSRAERSSVGLGGFISFALLYH